MFVPGCAVAAWWQINRAADGNQLSYLYSVMWPAFGVLGLYFWWMLIHTDYDSVGLKGMLRQQAAGSGDVGAPQGAWYGTVADTLTATVPPVPDIEDPGTGGLQQAPGAARRTGTEDLACPRVCGSSPRAMKRPPNAACAEHCSATSSWPTSSAS